MGFGLMLLHQARSSVLVEPISFGNQKLAARTLDSVPLGRIGTPEEIADLATFMMSNKASYMNGECVTLDGGQWLNQYPF